MEAALEEYTAYHDGVQVHRCGPEEENHGGGPDSDYDAAWERICMRQNPEIDRRMARLLRKNHRVYSPICWQMLHLFYRRGLCAESRGWEIVAARVGLPFRGGGRDRGHFQGLLSVAIEQLWLADADR